MNIRLSKELVDNAVLATVQILTLTESEKIALKQFGSPLIETGGAISGVYTRTTGTTPTPVLTGGGVGAELYLVIDEDTGAIEDVVVTAAGSGYVSPQLLLVNTVNGSGATFTITTDEVTGGIQTVVVTTEGSGYIPEQYTIQYTLPSSNKLLTSTFVARQRFDFAENRNADLHAEAYVSTIEMRIKNALLVLRQREAEYMGEVEKVI